jgi:hypothetical protein
MRTGKPPSIRAHRTLTKSGFVIIFICLWLFLPTLTNADTTPHFEIIVDAANIRNGPSRQNNVIGVAYEGQQFFVTGRDAAGEWLRVTRNRNATPNTWIFATLGSLNMAMNQLSIISESAPSSSPNPKPASYTPPLATPIPPASSSPYPTSYPLGMPQISYRARQIYTNGVARGRNANMFAVIGDSNSEHLQYQDRVNLGWHGLSAYTHLPYIVYRWEQGVRRQDQDEVVSVRGGLSAAELVQSFTHPLCASGESRFLCELRRSNASVVFIQVGTGDKFAWRDFERNMRLMLDYAISYSIVPILVTKADSIEEYQGGASRGFINGVIRKLASEYQLPLLDFELATSRLPTIPNPDLPNRPFTQHGLLDEWGYYFHLSDQAKSLRVLMTLLTLDAIAR